MRGTSGTRSTSTGGADSKSVRELMGLWLPLSPALLVVAVLVYALAEGPSAAKFLQLCGIGLMAGGAAWLLGALVGFLFGLPRTVAQVDIATPNPLGGAAETGPAVSTVRATAAVDGGRGPALMRTNTNLEEISDWLTKILVGLGLVQLGAFTRRLDEAGRVLADGLGNGPGAKPFALGLLIYALIDGFLFGYLWTRTVASLKLKRAEEELSRQFQRDQVELHRKLQRDEVLAATTDSVLQTPPPPAPPQMPPSPGDATDTSVLPASDDVPPTEQPG